MKTAKPIVPNYTADDYFADFTLLAKYAGGVIQGAGVLTHCCVCGEPAAAVNAVESDGEDLLLSYCAAHVDSDPALWRPDHRSHAATPRDETNRMSAITSLRLAYLTWLKREKGLPVVMRLLNIDSVTNPELARFSDSLGMVVDTEGNAYACPVPWVPSDGFIMGGNFAKDAVEVSESIRAGKTTANLLGKSWLLESNDMDLFNGGVKV